MAGKVICFKVKTKVTADKGPERNDEDEFRIKNFSQFVVLQKIKKEKYKPVEAEIKIDNIPKEAEVIVKDDDDESPSVSFEADSD